MLPVVRCIISSAVFVASVAPIAVVWSHQEFGASRKQQAESTLDRRLDAVAKDYLAQACYTTTQVANGIVLQLPDPVPASSCVTDGSRYGFIAVLDGKPRIFQVFPAPRVKARASELLTTTK